MEFHVWYFQWYLSIIDSAKLVYAPLTSSFPSLALEHNDRQWSLGRSCQGEDDGGLRIVGGKPATLGQFPYQVFYSQFWVRILLDRITKSGPCDIQCDESDSIKS